jgi:nicotinic acid mononucleotide adenylyltransferase
VVNGHVANGRVANGSGVQLRTGAYPGTFDPPTLAHLAIAEAAVRQCRLDRVDLVLSLDPLGKPGARATLEHRLRVLDEMAGRDRD